MTTRGWLYAGDGTLRSGWRLLAFAAAVFACAQLAQAFLYPLFAAASSMAGRPLRAFPWLDCLAVIAATQLVLRVCERRGWAFVGLGRAAARPSRIAAGALVGALAIGAPVAMLVALGWLRLAPAPDGSWWGAAGSLAVFLAPAALFEELLVRGYAFAVLREGAGTVVAVGATSVLFALPHARNPGADVRSLLVVALAGVVLAAVVVSLESLYAAWAAHFAWNWTMAALLHARVSGLAFAMPDYRVVDAGPDWLTGGAWGPEGGLAAAAGLLAALAYLVVRGRRPRDADPIARPLTPRGDLA